MRQLIGLVSFIFSALTASAQTAATTCGQWPQVKPMVQNLQRVVACSPHYSSKECGENIGDLGSATLAGASVGAMAGRNIQIKPPTACGLVSASRAFFFESVAWAACNEQVKAGAARIAEVLKKSKAVNEAELGNYLTEKLRAEHPDWDRLAQEVASTFQGSGSLSDSLKILKAHLQPMGIEITSLGQCRGPEEICDKIWSLAYSHIVVNNKEKVAMNTYRLAKYYPYDSKVMDFKNQMSLTEDLLRRVRSGLVQNESELENLFRRASGLVHPALKGVLADAANYISRLLPSLQSKEIFAKASSLKTVSAEFIAKNAKTLKKILPFGLATLIGVTGAANATEMAESLLPFGAAPTATGCSGLYSRYAPVDANSSTCQTQVGMTPEMIDFLTLPEEAQQTEVCRYGTLESTIRQLHQQEFPSSTKLSCSGDQVVVDGNSTSAPFWAQFGFQGDDLTSARVQKKLDGLKGYEFHLDPQSGSITGGKLLFPGVTAELGPKTKMAMVREPAEDFASRQVLAHLGRDCCRSPGSEACAVFQSHPSSSSSAATGSK